ncbi:hypothetical protein JL722_1522 [Aureococcus anophagefferens]|nr:hypothetical protein JL722_1522 [Aureococcus anophagefferens]
MAASLEAIQAAEASLARASLDNNSTDASTDPYADEDRIERDLETLPSKAKGPALAALAAAVKASRASFDVDAAAFVALVVDGGLRCVDVRSPGEFARGHVPGAVNAPLFDDASARSRDVFVEDEEGHVGTALVPPPLYELMRLAPVVLKIECAYETRVANLLEDYAEDAARDPGAFDGRLRDATRKVSKRLGGDRTAEALALLDARDLAGYARLLLERYYDKLYDKHLAARARTDAAVGAAPRAAAFDDAVDDGDKGGPPWCAPS